MYLENSRENFYDIEVGIRMSFDRKCSATGVSNKHGATMALDKSSSHRFDPFNCINNNRINMSRAVSNRRQIASGECVISSKCNDSY